MNLIMLIVLAALAVLGLIVGLVRGYVKTTIWGLPVLCSVFLLAVVEKIAAGMNDAMLSGAIMLAAGPVLILVLTFLFWLIKVMLVKSANRKMRLSSYVTAGARAAKEEQILDAIDQNDKKAYRKLVNKNVKITKGAAGVFNRINGAIAGCVNFAMGAFVAVSVVLMLVDTLGIASVENIFTEVLEAKWWVAASKYAVDAALLTLICVALRCGYSAGIANTFCLIVSVALVAAAGFAAYSLAFNSAIFAGVAQGLANGLIASFNIPMGDAFNLTLAKILLTVGLFVLLLVVVVIISIYLPRLVEKARVIKGFEVVDGIIGATLALALTLGVLIAVGGVLETLNGLDFMEPFNYYVTKSIYGNAMYENNVLATMNIFDSLPIRGWLEAVSNN